MEKCGEAGGLKARSGGTEQEVGPSVQGVGEKGAEDCSPAPAQMLLPHTD